MSTIHVEIVSAEGAIYSGDAEMVVAPAKEGDVGITPRHAPLMTNLRPGEVRIHLPDGEDELFFYVTGGVLEVTLERDRGSMTEQRFVELVTEVLQSDRRYHQKMYEVMGSVTRSTTGREGPVGDAERSPELVLPAIEAADGRVERDGRRL